MHPSTESLVMAATSTSSRVKNKDTGTAPPYSSVEVGFKRHSTTELDLDAETKQSLESARRFWDDPDFREQQNKEIAERKARR